MQYAKNTFHLRVEKLPNKTAETPAKSLNQRIHAIYDRLPERERRIADLLLQRPGDLAAHTATEVARHAEVSNATVTRFFRRLGFETFDAARQASRRLHAGGSPLYGVPRATLGSTFMSTMMREESAVLEATLSALNPLTLRDTAEAVASARRVQITGFRNSQACAEYLAAGLSQLRPDTLLMPTPAQSMAEALAQLCPDDVVVLLGLRRRPANFIELVKVASGTGASLLLITDKSIRAAPAFARWTLTCAVETNQSLDSYVGVMAVLRALTLSVAKHITPEGRVHLEKVEALHDKLSDLE
jgi:DNA-binding MurR/RpiR family transcriptional regulator